MVLPLRFRQYNMINEMKLFKNSQIKVKFTLTLKLFQKLINWCMWNYGIIMQGVKCKYYIFNHKEYI